MQDVPLLHAVLRLQGVQRSLEDPFVWLASADVLDEQHSIGLLCHMRSSASELFMHD